MTSTSLTYVRRLVGRHARAEKNINTPLPEDPDRRTDWRARIEYNRALSARARGYFQVQAICWDIEESYLFTERIKARAREIDRAARPWHERTIAAGQIHEPFAGETFPIEAARQAVMDLGVLLRELAAEARSEKRLIETITRGDVAAKTGP